MQTAIYLNGIPADVPILDLMTDTQNPAEFYTSLGEILSVTVMTNIGNLTYSDNKTRVKIFVR